MPKNHTLATLALSFTFLVGCGDDKVAPIKKDAGLTTDMTLVAQPGAATAPAPAAHRPKGRRALWLMLFAFVAFCFLRWATGASQFTSIGSVSSALEMTYLRSRSSRIVALRADACLNPSGMRCAA